MLSNEDKNLRPDDHLLHQIFPQSQSTRTTVLAQTFDDCTFVAHQCGSSEEDVVVRLEISKSSDDSNRFRTIAALQTIARLAIPDLVPTTERYGMTTTADGRNVHFLVTKFIHDTVTLESVWDDLEEEQQVRIVKELLEAVKKLHAIRLSDSTVVQILEGTGFAPPTRSSESSAIVIGSPNTGYFTDIPEFLERIIKSHSHLSSDPVTGNITIHSEYDDTNPVLIRSDDLQHLQDSVVLCHNDLEPRNILVHPKELGNGTTSYFIAAIIDWEMSGFFPFSYEYVYKDLFLGNANLYFTWYTLFKEHGVPLVPMSPLPTSHASFMEAIELIQHSHDRGKEPMYALITKMWIAREDVVRQQPAGTGWLKKNGQRSKRIPEAEIDKLVDQILKERARK